MDRIGDLASPDWPVYDRAVLYGREAERAAIGRVLEAARRSRSGALVLRGEPGVGKTALLTYATERAADMRVLRGAGVESESELPFASLHQILRPVLGRSDAIPPPQATALRGALGLAPAYGHDRFLIALAVLSLLSELAEERPLLCVVDDAQWLDPASADALLFVARRLDAEGIALLLATSDTGGAAFRRSDLPEFVVRGLDQDASDALLRERLGSPPAPRVRDVLSELTRGNPLALIELSAALTGGQLQGREPLPEHPRVGMALEHAFLTRAGRLPGPTQTLLLVAAAEGTGDLGLVLRAAAKLGVDSGSLEPAELAGLVQVDEAGIVFRSPLVRSVVYRAAPFGRRQAAHRALADALAGEADADRRTWHRSVAAVAPDDAVAEELDRSAERARRRGGYAAAAAALERAADLTSARAGTGRRLAAAAADAWMAGRADRTRELLERAGPLVSEPQLLADLDYLRGLLELDSGNRQVAYQIFLTGSQSVAPVDTQRAVRMLTEAGRTAWADADIPRMIEVGRRMEALELPGQGPEVFPVKAMIGLGRLGQGDAATAVPLIRAAVSQADRDDPEQLHIAGAVSMFTGADRTAHELLTHATARARALGAVAMLPRTLGTLAPLEMWQGDFPSATAHASEGLRLARETGLEHAATQFLAALAWIAAVQGRTEDCVALAAAALNPGGIRPLRSAVAIATWALALSDIGIGSWSEAIARLEAVAAPQSPVSHPMVARLAAADLVEAAHRVGRLDLAQTALARFESFARPSAAPWTLALLSRCRALLSAGATAGRFFQEALQRHADGGRPFDEARTRLLYGEFLRRGRRRAEARAQLRGALETFERLGASPWEERAGAELRATGETARKREPGTLTRLTPQQLQIVRLVTEGATNKEAAAQLFLSPRTVDYHLRNVFVKLGISSRAELIRLPEINESTHASR
jgi:DNA-binding CsgD family transcriptional regulator